MATTEGYRLPARPRNGERSRHDSRNGEHAGCATGRHVRAGGAARWIAAPRSCPTYGTPSTLARLEVDAIDESSGLAASSRHSGVYWVHNDSGDAARAFAVSSEGKLLTTLSFDTAMPTDIEDMAIEDESPERSFLYFGDIGDNGLVRRELTIHRIGAFSAGKTAATEKIAEVAIDLPTSGEISRDGHIIGMRNYSPNAFFWIRLPGERREPRRCTGAPAMTSRRSSDERRPRAACPLVRSMRTKESVSCGNSLD